MKTLNPLFALTLILAVGSISAILYMDNHIIASVLLIIISTIVITYCMDLKGVKQDKKE
ncbi:MAG: hypothetical protein JST58_08985 [Bacteroidetes bacterium]|jgi:hypothetical protein|nr:hypothetical protein [Bacteroidota bacterium]